MSTRKLAGAPCAFFSVRSWRFNVWSYDYPRFTRPFYYGIAAQNMVFLIMFNKAWTDEDEIRFSLFKFKLPKRPRPAWDFQYVIHNAAEPQPKRGTAILAVRTGRMPVPPGAWKIFAAREEA